MTGQALQASLGMIPVNALAIAVIPNGLSVDFRFEMSELTEQDEEDIEDIVSEFETLTGYILEVTRSIDIVEHRTVTPTNWWWIHMNRAGHLANTEGIRSLQEDYLGKVQGVLIEAGQFLTNDQLSDPWGLVEHGEPAEGLVILAWTISEGQVRVPPAVIDGIRRLSAELVPPEDLPPDLDRWALPELVD